MDAMWQSRGARAAPKTKTLDVNGLGMAYEDAGSGRPIVFLHGGVGSMYMWRNVMPHLIPSARCVAVDLIGTGESDRIKGASATNPYSWAAHVGYLDEFLGLCGIVNDVTLVMHGWGSVVGLTWALQHEDRVSGLAYMEAITRPLAWHELPGSFRDTVKLARSVDGERYVVQSDEYFDDCLVGQVDAALPSNVRMEYLRNLGPVGEERRAQLAALTGIPIGGKPGEAASDIRQMGEWLKSAAIPKLLILGEPGYLLTDFGRRSAAQITQQSVARVSGVHLLPEESPDVVGRFLRLWWQQLP
jgi:haloalkane dehalogenase